MNKSKIYIFFIVFFMHVTYMQAQLALSKIDSFFVPSVKFNPGRFYTALGFGTMVYTGGTYTLYNYWYKEKGLGKFHFFDDWNEWYNMDKVGHIYSAYNMSSAMYDMSRWTGLSSRKSVWFGICIGALMQSTIEVLDGFSPKWGFSVYDMGANALGLGLFYFQERYWNEQRILLKVSSRPVRYPEERIYDATHKHYTSLRERADRLFGSSFLERYLKDYNAQTYWLSFNMRTLLGSEKILPWLNIAIGYSGENMFGGYGNAWTDDSGVHYDISGQKQRYYQFFISPDIDFNRIKTGSHFINSLLRFLNLVKLPAPALEITSKGRIIFHIVYM